MARPLRWRRLGSLGKLALAALIPLTGCTSSERLEYLTVNGEQYEMAFDAAAEVARREGLDSIFVDRRGGTLEAGPEIAGSLLEPWRTDNSSLGQALENTISFQRRRARFEFLPVGFVPPTIPAGDAPLTGPGPIALEPALDLVSEPQNLELRVWVYVERANTPGIRRFAWTRRGTTNFVDPEAERIIEQSGSPETLSTWTPVGRDIEAEYRLLAAVKQRLDRLAPPPASQAESADQSSDT